MKLLHASAFILLIVFANKFNAQSSLAFAQYSETYSSDCTNAQYYDIITLRCTTCPIGSSTTASDRYNCKCNSGYRYLRKSTGGSVQCEACTAPAVQSSTGWECVTPQYTTCNSTTSIKVERDQYGELLPNAQQCYTCKKTSPVNNQCIPCFNWLYTNDQTLQLNTYDCTSTCDLFKGGICFLGIDTTDANRPTDYTIYYGNTVVNSWYFGEQAIAAYYQCKSSQNRNHTACQLLANICTLLLFKISTSSAQIDPCKSFNSLTGGNLPWIAYSSSEKLGFYKTLSEASVDIKLSYTGQAKCQDPTLAFYAARYALNGTLLNFGALDFRELQLCELASSYSSKVGGSWISYNYLKECNITLKSFINKEPVFYDIYLRYMLTNGSYALLPVPVIILNFQDETNTEVNRLLETGASNRMHRRFFLYDTVAAKGAENSVPTYVRYAKSIKIRFDLFDNSNQGRIYPPLVIIDYDYKSTVDINTKIGVGFRVEYKMNLDTQIRDIWISVGVLSFFGLLWSLIRTWIWNKRSGKINLDIVTIFKFLMYCCNTVSNVFFIVLVGVCIWWLIFFKGQDLAFVMLPVGTQEDSIKALLIIAFAFKIFDILHLILVQSSYHIFLIDWERPKLKSENKGSVSCWRTLFVANEWNEIQTFRKTNTPLQLFFVLLLLKVVNLEAICTADCNTSVVRDENEYTAPYSSILRIGMAASMYILLGFTQWIIYNFIYTRCIGDKLGQFVDFCSVSNISIFIRTHSQFGYYIHGRSPHGNADANMKQMVLSLEKEGNDLVAKRGLLPDTDHQIFSMALTDKLQKQYFKVMGPLNDRHVGKADDQDKKNIEKSMDAYTKLNNFLMSFVDHSLRDIDYIVVTRNFIENVFNIELRDPLDKGIFYQDSGYCFENALFAGKERTLFIFELLIFLFVDYFSQNYVLAAFCVYIVHKGVNILRSDLSKINLSRKTLVDKRFLI